MKYEVIIVGASFAGLAVASKIKNGRRLLIDSKPIGSGLKSACGTVLDTVLKLGLGDCVLQVHKEMILHTSNPSLDFSYHLESPFCVIDGKKFCQKLFEKEKTDFLLANVLSFDGTSLRTDRGVFQPDILVDASGPNSVLTENKNQYLSFGLETIVDLKEQGLHFYYFPKIFPKGVFWLFPQGKTSRIGIASYLGKTNLLPYLDEFLKRFGLKRGNIHGGYFPHRLRKPIYQKIFLVGDAAGQCLPLTGEGIRPAIFFGQKLGEIVNLILEGKITLEEGLNLYSDFVFKDRRKLKYELLYQSQRFFINIPQFLLNFFARLVSKKPVTNFVLKKYLGILK